jgi:hypothetical protein
VIVRIAMVLGVLLLVAGCSGPTDDDDTTVDDDTADDDDTGATGRAMLSYAGDAIADAALYTGTESLVLVDDDGMGAVLCRVGYTLTGTAPRDDCDECLWAWDLELSVATITDESGAGCDPLGHDTATVAAMNGTTRAYGFAEEYVGHADMLMIDIDGWQGVSFATWHADSGTFDYGWDDAFVEF